MSGLIVGCFTVFILLSANVQARVLKVLRLDHPTKNGFNVLVEIGKPLQSSANSVRVYQFAKESHQEIVEYGPKFEAVIDSGYWSKDGKFVALPSEDIKMETPRRENGSPLVRGFRIALFKKLARPSASTTTKSYIRVIPSQAIFEIHGRIKGQKVKGPLEEIPGRLFVHDHGLRIYRIQTSTRRLEFQNLPQEVNLDAFVLLPGREVTTPHWGERDSFGSGRFGGGDTLGVDTRIAFGTIEGETFIPALVGRGLLVENRFYLSQNMYRPDRADVVIDLDRLELEDSLHHTLEIKPLSRGRHRSNSSVYAFHATERALSDALPRDVIRPSVINRRSFKAKCRQILTGTKI